MFARRLFNSIALLALGLTTTAWSQSQQTDEEAKKKSEQKKEDKPARPGYPIVDNKDKKDDLDKDGKKKSDKDKTSDKEKPKDKKDELDKDGKKKTGDEDEDGTKKDPRDPKNKTTKDSEKDKVSDPKRNPMRPVGMNTPLPENYQPFIYESGPFEGLEPFGYGYFASAREAVQLRSMIKKEPNLLKTDETTNALNTILGPAQMTFTNAELPAPERYQLGPGDKLLVRYSSPTQELKEKAIVVDATGNIITPVMGTKMTIRGMTLAQAQAAVEKDIRRGLREANVTLTLSELRTISVSVVGEVVAQGNYQFPSVMTLFNALYAAGGPTINGSMRKIQLRRSNGKAITVDLYAYLLKGDASQDIPLQPGDLIVVPIANKRVAAKGEFSRPAVYELSDIDRVKDLVKYAGGAKPTAITDRTEIESVNAGVEKQLINVNLKSDDPAENPTLKDADIITLYPVRDAIENVVTLEGAVDQPRSYQFQTGMTVADAVERARGVLADAYTLRADLYRLNDDRTTQLIQIDLAKAIRRDATANVVLRRQDRLRVYFTKEVNWLEDRLVIVNGAVRNPGKFVRMDGMRLSDVLLQAGGLLPDASRDFIFVYRKNPDGTEGPLTKVDGNLALGGATEHNILLQDRDVVVIYDQARAKFMPERSVRIVGAIRMQGTYPRSENLMLRDLVLLAGGLLPKAGKTIQITHARVNEGLKPDTYQVADLLSGKANPAILDGDVVSVTEDGNFQEAPQLVEIRGRVKNPGIYAIQSRTETLSELIKRAGGLNDGAWAEGAQFLRSPQFLMTDAERRFSPRVREVLENVQEQEYLRALAKSDIDKIRLLASQGGNQSLSAFAQLGGAGAAQTPLPTADSQAIMKQLQSRETVTPARPLSNDELLESGNIPVRLDLAIRNEKSNHNVILRDGDIVSIPEKPTTVAIRGAVIVPSTILFERRKTLQYYLDRAGGPTTDADRTEILVIRATGTVTKARGSTRIELGDTIFVPTKVMVAKLTDGSSSFEGFIKQITNAGLIWAIFRNLTR
jgi:protein involved in polysaccharide export with SLBB domain